MCVIREVTSHGAQNTLNKKDNDKNDCRYDYGPGHQTLKEREICRPVGSRVASREPFI